MPGLLLVRVGAPLYFANVQWVEDKFRDYEKKAAKYSSEAGSRLRFVIWDLSPVNHMDMQGITLLEELHEYFASKDVQLVLTNPATGVVQAWEAAGLFKKLQRDWVFARVHDAVAACHGLLAEHESLKAEYGRGSVELSARAHVRM
jgi:MFS superfamily sulfate permease-like transporter